MCFMRLKGNSLIEIVIAMMVWASFLYLFQAYQVQKIYERHIYEKTLHHYHLIEHVYMLKTLHLIEFDTCVLNQYGVLDPFGLYEVIIIGDQFKLYYEGIIIYDSDEH